jgi:hypothetical protein
VLRKARFTFVQLDSTTLINLFQTFQLHSPVVRIPAFKEILISAMAIVSSIVAKSTNTSTAALNLNAKAYEVRQTVAGIWDLAATPAEALAPEATFQLDMKNESGESVIGENDERVQVPDQDFAPGGKYRCMYLPMLLCAYVDSVFSHRQALHSLRVSEAWQWAMGTGWLIRPDLLVTAGHCSYDWSHNLGRATEVKAYIGYKGNESIKTPNVQFRHVSRIVTTMGWLRGKGAKNFDVSFMRLDKPFTGVTPLKYKETPPAGEAEIGVVGYPGDLQDMVTKEKGANMYEMFLKVSREKF